MRRRRRRPFRGGRRRFAQGGAMPGNGSPTPGTDGNWYGYSGYQNYGGNPDVSGLAAPNYNNGGNYGGWNTYGHQHYAPYQMNQSQWHSSGLNPYRRGGRIRKFNRGGGVFAGTPCSGINGYGSNC